MQEPAAAQTDRWIVKWSAASWTWSTLSRGEPEGRTPQSRLAAIDFGGHHRRDVAVDRPATSAECTASSSAQRSGSATGHARRGNLSQHRADGMLHAIAVDLRLLLISGPPGAGKSTVAEAVAAESDLSVLLHTDDFFHCVRSGYVLPWKGEAHRQNAVVLRAAGASAAAFLGGGYTVVIDGLIGPWLLDELLSHVPRTATVDYVVLRPSAEVAMERAVNRTVEGALIEPEPIAYMYGEFADLGRYESHVIDSSAQTPEETAQLLLGDAAARFRIQL